MKYLLVVPSSATIQIHQKHLIVKEEHEVCAIEVFDGTGVQITAEGKRHLGAAIGSRSFAEEYVGRKVEEWTEEIKRLAKVAVSQPHAAYAAFTHGMSSRWTYLMRTIPNLHDILLPLEEAICQHLIPALTGRTSCSTAERDLLALPVRLGGLGLANPATLSSPSFQALGLLTKPLVDLIRSQETNQTVNPETTSDIKKSIMRLNRLRHIQQADSVQNHLTLGLKRSVELAKEKGASSWLSVLPLEEHGFYLHKGEFRDALCLRYGWQLNNIPQTCKCGTQFTVDHAMMCHLGGFPTIRHNEIRDITATLLTEVCHNVATEPPLQPLTGETLTARSANTNDSGGSRIS